METTSFLKLTFFMMFLALTPTTKCQFIRPPPHAPAPLCAYQFALVNHACETIPYTPMIPLSPPPSPPAPNPPSNDTQTHKHVHRHGHRHRQRGSFHTTPVEENCCRWLKDVDNKCVCELLVRFPLFLARPAHSYTVGVGNACVYTYQCAGRLRAN